MAEKIITVTLNGTSVLRLDPAAVDINHGDQAVWRFPALPSNQFGFVFFEPRLGPFHSLRSVSNREILGKGNVGSKSNNLYSYNAMILELGTITPIATGGGTINNLATQVNTTPEVFVTYHQDHPPTSDIPNHLEVKPFALSLNPGDTATWYFINFPEGAFPDFQFDAATPDMQEAIGPFVAFYACDGRGAVTVRANGTGFVTAIDPGARRSRYHYHIEVRTANGHRLASHDPVIDNLGELPVPP